jgi:hypothetical protein
MLSKNCSGVLFSILTKFKFKLKFNFFILKFELYIAEYNIKKIIKLNRDHLRI